MPKSALELVAQELQHVTLGESDITRAVSMAQPTNERVRGAADKHLRFEDEPASYLAFLRDEADTQ